MRSTWLWLLLLAAVPWVGAGGDLRAAEGEARVAHGSSRAWLGVFLGEAVDGGLEIAATVAGGPADRHGLRAGDVIVRAEEVEIADPAALKQVLVRFQAGQPMQLQVLRSGRLLDREVVLGERRAWTVAPPAPASAASPEEPPKPRGLQAGRTLRVGSLSAYGIAVAEVTPALREHFGAPADAGVLITSIDAGGPAQSAGFRVGDLVIRLGDHPVKNAAQVETLLCDAEGEPPTLAASVVRGRPPEMLELVVPTVTKALAVRPARPATSADPAPEERERHRQAIRREIRRLEERIEELRRQLDGRE